MKFTFKVTEAGFYPYPVRIELSVDDKIKPAQFFLLPSQWEALKQILGSGAVGMQMQGQDIQVEIL